MANNHQKQKNEIRKNFFSQNYTNTINLCKKLLKELKKICGDFFTAINQEMGWCYYYLSSSYKKLNNIKESIKYAKKAVKHGLNRYYEENNFSTEAKILLAENYEYTNQSSKAIRNYKECIKFYKLINCNDNRRQMVFRIAKLIRSPKGMLNVIKLTERENNPELSEDIVNEYLDLISFYISSGNFTEVAILISNIQDIKVKLEVAGALKNLVPRTA